MVWPIRAPDLSYLNRRAFGLTVVHDIAATVALPTCPDAIASLQMTQLRYERDLAPGNDLACTHFTNPDPFAGDFE
jgi:hypothetical protein